MRLSISGRVVKSYAVEVFAPRLVECNEEFQKLGNHLTVLSVDEENPKSENVEQPCLVSTAFAETEAKEKAALILAEAEKYAQEVRDQVRADSDRLRQEVIQTAQAEVYPVAQAEGYQVGYQAGYQEGFQVGESEGQRLTKSASQLFQLAQRAVQEEYVKVDEDLLHLAIKIAERIVRASLVVEPQRLMGIIQALSLLPQEREGWRLHVAPEDARWLEDHQPPCPFVSDESLSSGDCFLECQEGIFDARLEAQLDKLEHTLREELEHGAVEFVDPDGGTN